MLRLLKPLASERPGPLSVTMPALLPLIPLQKFPEGGAAMAVLRFFFCRQLRKCFLNRGKIKERVVAEAIRAARSVEDHPFGSATEHRQGLAIPRRGYDTDETSSALLWWDTSKLSNQARVIRLIISIVLDQVGSVGGVARGVNAGSASERVDFESGIVGKNNFTWKIVAVILGFLAGVGFESEAVFDYGGKGREVGKASNVDSASPRGTGKVAKLTWIRSGDQDASYGHYLGLRATRPTKNRAVAPETIPPSVRSQVRVKVMSTRFSPASTGTIIWPVTS